jgi:hypothetical protein
MALPLDPLAGANLLALDGGGIKGISTLWVLKTIMDKVRDLEIKSGVNPDTNPRLPVNYFHLAAGTSTGGIIAIMLFRLGMNCDDAIKEYMIIGKDVFGKEAPRGGARFEAEPLERAVDNVVGTYGKDKEKVSKGNTPLRNGGAKM